MHTLDEKREMCDTYFTSFFVCHAKCRNRRKRRTHIAPDRQNRFKNTSSLILGQHRKSDSHLVSFILSSRSKTLTKREMGSGRCQSSCSGCLIARLEFRPPSFSIFITLPLEEARGMSKLTKEKI